MWLPTSWTILKHPKGLNMNNFNYYYYIFNSVGCYSIVQITVWPNLKDNSRNKGKKQSIYYTLSFYLGLDFKKTSGKKYWTKDVCKNCNFCQKCIFVNGFGVWIFCQFCIFFLTAAWQLRGRFELSLGKWSFTPFPSFSI